LADNGSYQKSIVCSNSNQAFSTAFLIIMLIVAKEEGGLARFSCITMRE